MKFKWLAPIVGIIAQPLQIIALIALNILIHSVLVCAAFVEKGILSFRLIKSLCIRTGKRVSLGVSSSNAANSSPADVTVIAIHGTFAQGADWATPGASLSKHIKRVVSDRNRTLDWRWLTWTGGNTVTERAQAVTLLCNALDDLFESNPERHVILIAHSHGGNIALKAAERFTENKNLRLVTMATPFLFAQTRPAAQAILDTTPPVYCIAWGIVAWSLTALVAPQAGYEAFGYLPVLAGGLATILALVVLAKEWDVVENDRQRLLQSTPDPKRIACLAGRTLICSRASDEADGGLKVAALLSNWMSQQMRHAKFDPSNLKIDIITQFQYLLKILAAAACMMLLHRAIGTRTGTAAVTVAVSSSETPPGAWQHIQSLPFFSEHAESLAHSQIYKDQEVLRAIAQWIGKAIH